MSRSYRKPWYTDGYKGSKRKQYYKRYYNKIIRKIDALDEDILSDGNMFKKINCRYNICEFRSYYTGKSILYFNKGIPFFIEPDPYWKVGRK